MSRNSITKAIRMCRFDEEQHYCTVLRWIWRSWMTFCEKKNVTARSSVIYRWYNHSITFFHVYWQEIVRSVRVEISCLFFLSILENAQFRLYTTSYNKLGLGTISLISLEVGGIDVLPYLQQNFFCWRVFPFPIKSHKLELCFYSPK